jgi:hypothetical protein
VPPQPNSPPHYVIDLDLGNIGKKYPKIFNACLSN